MTITRDMEIGEVVGPSCPCDAAGEWVSTCAAHPVNPDARGCPCACHTREWKGIWKAAFNCRDCGDSHRIGAKHGPPQCTATKVALHRCREKDGHEGGRYHRSDDGFAWSDPEHADGEPAGPRIALVSLDEVEALWVKWGGDERFLEAVRELPTL